MPRKQRIPNKKQKDHKVTKSQAKATKAKITKLNSDLQGFETIKQLIHLSISEKPQTNVLDAKDLKQDLKKLKQDTEANKKVETDIESQLNMLTGMGL